MELKENAVYMLEEDLYPTHYDVIRNFEIEEMAHFIQDNCTEEFLASIHSPKNPYPIGTLNHIAVWLANSILDK